jgi:DNA replication protein DnaC
MQGQDTTISTFHQLFNPISTEKFLQLVKEMGVDKYVKKLHTIQLIELIAYALLEQQSSTSKQAVENQIFIALITYCLLILMKLKVGYKGYTLSFDERLAMIVDAQWLAKANSRLKRLLKQANLRDASASLEDINYDPRRNLDKATIARLADCTWIREGKNLIITGATGTGKTYLISAFGNAACRKGLKVRSYKVNRLLTDLAISRGDGSYNRLLNDLKKPDLLILDDFGMAPLTPSACRDLLEVIELKGPSLRAKTHKNEGGG